MPGILTWLTSAHLSPTAVNLWPDPLVCVSLGTSCLGGVRIWRIAGASIQAQPSEQSHQIPVWLLKPHKQMRLDKSESPAGSALGGGSERGRQLSDGKSKGTGRRWCSRAMRGKCWGIDGMLTDLSSSRWQRFWNTSMRLLCSTWHALTCEPVRANLDPSLSTMSAQQHRCRTRETWRSETFIACWCMKRGPKLTVQTSKRPPEGPGSIFNGETLTSFYCRCKIYALASRQSEPFSRIQGQNVLIISDGNDRKCDSGCF